ncbi:MAG: hypothetical protein ACJAXY_001671 [Nonlabens sp.]|jgi:hypothetical protein
MLPNYIISRVRNYATLNVTSNKIKRNQHKLKKLNNAAIVKL